MEQEIVFIAYSKKLLRCLLRIKEDIDDKRIDQAIIELEALIEETKTDITDR